jgi:hypothetical protein
MIGRFANNYEVSVSTDYLTGVCNLNSLRSIKRTLPDLLERSKFFYRRFVFYGPC